MPVAGTFGEPGAFDPGVSQRRGF